MTVLCDLNFLQFNRESGKDKGPLPGFTFSAPPRRVARGREGDHLFIYLSLSGNNPIQLDEYTKITGKMTEIFYAASGSLTAALRSTADMFNQVLRTRNLGTTGHGQYIVGRLVMGVLRSNKLFIVQSGPTHVFHLGKTNKEHLHDPALSGRGLGFTQTTTLYYSQLNLSPGEHIVLTPQLPEGWMDALASERGDTSLDSLRRKLRSISTGDASALIGQVVKGSGTFNVISSVVPIEPATYPDPQMEIPDFPRFYESQNIQTKEDSLPETEFMYQESDVEPNDNLYQDQTQEFSEDQNAFNDQISKIDPSSTTSQSRHPSRFMNLIKGSGSYSRIPQEKIKTNLDGSAAVSPQFRDIEQQQVFDSSFSTQIPEIKRFGSSVRKPILSGILAGIQGIRRIGSNISLGFKTLINNIFPSASIGKTHGMSGSSMAFIAMFIPVIVVIVASSVYVKFGRSAQYNENYQMAINEAVGAIGQDEPAVVRRAWESALFYLDQADSYQVTQDSYTLRLQAQGALDAMDQIIRLDFRPAIYGGLPRSIKISKMAAGETDLYMLDDISGNIIRALLTANGYIIDDSFVCGPGTYSSIDRSTEISRSESFDVEAIIDMQALSRVNPYSGSSLIAMDASGTLVFCNPNSEPFAWKLKEPDIRWKNPIGFSLSGQDGTIYILDPDGNAVWSYEPDSSGIFSTAPGLFFSGDYVPNDLNQARDIAVAGTDIYLLFNDGHVSSCTPGQLGDVVPLRCNDPITMTDMRSGYQSGIVLSDASFTELSFTTPPDPSVYLLAPLTAAVYRFSPRPDTLFLQNQFRAAVEQDKTLFSSPITSMAISPNRSIFLCSGSQVYFSTDIP